MLHTPFDAVIRLNYQQYSIKKGNENFMFVSMWSFCTRAIPSIRLLSKTKGFNPQANMNSLHDKRGTMIHSREKSPLL